MKRPTVQEGPISRMERELAKKEAEDKRNFLVIPRRPQWTSETKTDELTLMESQSFAEWKYRISQTVQMLQHCQTTPFERNLDFWRQLWRVVERSDIVAQIVDARNPLLFFTEDLYKYCTELEHPKKFFLLINKADFLSDSMRRKWTVYFKRRNIEFKFFCAIEAEQSVTKAASEASSVLSGKQLIEYIKSIELGHQLTPTYRSCGFIGYPNVGKSSTINHLIGASKTSTSATPGKTKHFQTLFIDSTLCLCDCPGLVMPNFVNSKADLLTNGILPIDQATEFISPVQLIGDQVGWGRICRHYGFSEDKLSQIDARGFLNKFAASRGFKTARGNPDVSKSAKYVLKVSSLFYYLSNILKIYSFLFSLKDYVNGKLVFCHPPPDDESEQESKVILPQPDVAQFVEPKLSRNDALEARIDSQFFSSHSQVHVKGIGGSLSANDPSGERLSKKHHKGNKKQKLRRVYNHLDE